MKIKTESIQIELTSFFCKNIEEVNESDLSEIEFITIRRFIDENYALIDYKELLYFPNLKTVEFDSIIFENDILEIISEIPKLESIIFRRCDFINKLDSIESIKQIKSLSVIASPNFDISNIVDLNNIEVLLLHDFCFSNIEFLINHNIVDLNINRCNITSSFSIECINSKKLTISIDLYNKYKEEFDKFTGKLIVIGENGIYPEFERGVE